MHGDIAAASGTKLVNLAIVLLVVWPLGVPLHARAKDAERPGHFGSLQVSRAWDLGAPRTRAVEVAQTRPTALPLGRPATYMYCQPTCLHTTSGDSLPSELPPMYHVLAPKDEEGPITEIPPKECLKFKNPKDPDGKLGIHGYTSGGGDSEDHRACNQAFL